LGSFEDLLVFMRLNEHGEATEAAKFRASGYSIRNTIILSGPTMNPTDDILADGFPMISRKAGRNFLPWNECFPGGC
jgi:hypothetical protein